MTAGERRTVFSEPTGVPAGGVVPCKRNLSALIFLTITATRKIRTLTIQAVRREPVRVVLDASILADRGGVGGRRLARDAGFVRRLDRTGGDRGRSWTGSGDNVDGERSGGRGRRSRETSGGELRKGSWNRKDERDERGEERSESDVQVHGFTEILRLGGESTMTCAKREHARSAKLWRNGVSLPSQQRTSLALGLGLAIISVARLGGTQPTARVAKACRLCTGHSIGLLVLEIHFLLGRLENSVEA
jgi:hypothetical protein